MSELSISQRFDQFQDYAVTAINSDFTEKTNGRFLLVIPTGGGKTFVAAFNIMVPREGGLMLSSS